MTAHSCKIARQNSSPRPQELLLTASLGSEDDMVSFMYSGYAGSSQSSTHTDQMPSTIEAAGSRAVSSLSSGPPPVGPQPNREYNWIHTWQDVRRHITTYSSAVGRRDAFDEPAVHLLVQRHGRLAEHDISCPDRFLTADCPIHHFVQHVQHFALPFDEAHTRVFPVAVELLQNVPSVIAMDMLEPGRRPLCRRDRAPSLPIKLRRSKASSRGEECTSPHTLQHLLEEERIMGSPESSDPHSGNQDISLYKLSGLYGCPES